MLGIIHVCIPLAGGGVEEAPAGCILRRHHTPVRTTQHGHHIVLDGTCNGEVLEELGSSVETHSFRFYIHVTKAHTQGGLHLKKNSVPTCVSCTRGWLRSRTLWLHWDVSLVLVEKTGSRCCSVRPARWPAGWCLLLWRSLWWTNRNLKNAC